MFIVRIFIFKVLCTMPSTVNQQRQLAALQGKQNKTPQDQQQIAALEKKLAAKPPVRSQAARGPRVRNKRAQPAQLPRTVPDQRDGFGGMMTSASYKDYLLKMDRTGETPAGRAWHHLAMHPPSAPLAEFAGLPDYTSQPRVTPQFRTEWNVAWDATMFASAPSDPTTFDIWMAIPDVPEVAAVYMLHDVKNGNYSNLKYVRTSTFDTVMDSVYHVYPGLQDLGYSMARITSSSCTAIYSGTTLGDAGVVWCASLSPIVEHTNIAMVGQLPAGLPTATTPTTDNDWDIDFGIVPLTAKALVQRDPAHYKGRAREGVFAVQKFDKSLMGYDYSDAGSGAVLGLPRVGTTTVFSVPNCMAVIPNDVVVNADVALARLIISGDRITPPSGVNSNLPTNDMVGTLMSGVSHHSGMAWTVIRVDGLSIAQAESFAFTRTITIDAQVPSNSTLTPYLRAVPDWDDVAIRAVMHGQRIMPSGFPSNCNGFMDWVRGIFGFLNKNSRPILDVVKALPIPGAAVAADIAENVIPTVNGMLSGSTV